MLKMHQSSLSGLVEPAVVCVADVCGDYVCSDVTYGPEEFARAPEVTFAEMVSQPGMLPEQADVAVATCLQAGASAFQQLKRTGDAHRGRQAHEHVHMVRLDLQLENLHPVFPGDFTQKTLAVVADHCELERVFCIFGFPYEMECVLPYSVAMSQQSFHFSRVRAQNFRIAHANFVVRNGCANYAARTHLLRNSAENKDPIKGERYRVRNSSAA
jgi:hypothetical protein